MKPLKWCVCAVTFVVSSQCGSAPSLADAGSAGGGAAGGVASAAGGSAGGGSAGGSATAMKRAFVTSRTWTGNLKGMAASGVLGADAKCQAAAAMANLPGTFKAYVSTDTLDALDRMADVGPWVTRDVAGAPVVVLPSRAALADLNASRTFTTDETGAALPATKDAWTGNLPNGKRDMGTTCRSWESSAATDNAEVGSLAGQAWQHDGPATCDQQRRLLCLEQ
ncbi:MAG: hypothetical protein GQE15_14040 [Archangiaceae bacterium]|nr:hypothetical protein [Archangiaceae bacterium]